MPAFLQLSSVRTACQDMPLPKRDVIKNTSKPSVCPVYYHPKCWMETGEHKNNISGRKYEKILLQRHKYWGESVYLDIIYNFSREVIYSINGLAFPSASPEDNLGWLYIFVSSNPRHRSYSPKGNIAPLHQKDSNYTYPMPYPNLVCENIVSV